MSNPRKNRVKLSDIALVSGVSLTAVSLALNEKPGISNETRARVTEIARSMGYRFKYPTINAAVKSLKTIGLLVKSGPEDEPHANSFYSSIIAGVDATCRQMGITLMFANLPVNSEDCAVEIPSLLEKKEVDGLILAGIYADEDFVRLLNSRSGPVVLVDSYSKTGFFNSVLSDNIQGIYQAAEYLIRRGHREIGFIGGHDRAFPSFVERRAGYRKALEDYQIRQHPFVDCSINRNEVALATMELMKQNPQVTAIVGVNDDTAITAMYTLIEAGYRIPQDISIIGFDDIFLAESVVPSLTTMRVNKQSMGRLAVQLLLNQVIQAESELVTSVFRPVLIERNSVRSIC